MEMKKILGILLAVCFVMSVTAAAVSAGDSRDNQQGPQKDGKDFKKGDNKGPVKFEQHKKFNDYKKPKFVWKCHTEYKRVLVKIIYKHHSKPIKIYKWKAFKVCKKVPVFRGHR
jgi:Ni/Co efflux regulator RcnB